MKKYIVEIEENYQKGDFVTFENKIETLEKANKMFDLCVKYISKNEAVYLSSYEVDENDECVDNTFEFAIRKFVCEE